MSQVKAQTSAKAAYHHGNLRNALIIAAAEVIERDGVAGFSLAKAARQAGVSAAAPYRHFRDKDDLLGAVVHLAFYALGERCESHASAYAIGSSEYILALGEAYLTFTIEHKAFYELMWGDVTQRQWDEDVTQNHCGYAFRLLFDAVGAWHQQHTISSDTPMNIALRMWANVQGFATLSINNYLQVFEPEADPIALFRASARSGLTGLLHTG